MPLNMAAIAAVVVAAAGLVRLASADFPDCTTGPVSQTLCLSATSGLGALTYRYSLRIILSAMSIPIHIHGRQP